MTNLEGILKSSNVTLPTKVNLVKAMVFPVVMYECESWIAFFIRKLSTKALMLLICGIGTNSWESLGLQEFKPVHPKGNQSWEKDWCWSWNSNPSATWCKELTHWKRPWCWERLKAEGEGDDRGWDGWMASVTRWTWVWVNSGSWWGTRRPGMLWFMGSQRVRHDWATKLNWTELSLPRLLRWLLSWLLSWGVYKRQRLGIYPVSVVTSILESKQ